MLAMEAHGARLKGFENMIIDDGNFLQDDYRIAITSRSGGAKLHGISNGANDSALAALSCNLTVDSNIGSSTSSSTTAGNITDYEDDEVQEGSTLIASVESDNEEDCINETIGLLSGSRTVASPEGWGALDVNFGRRPPCHLATDKMDEPDDLQIYLNQERLRGMEKIRTQMSQAVHVFRELSHLINDQQDDFELLDASVYHTKANTSAAVDELFKANRLKQRARKRRAFMIFLTVVVAIVVLFTYLYRGGNGAVTVGPLQTPARTTLQVEGKVGAALPTGQRTEVIRKGPTVAVHGALTESLLRDEDVQRNATERP